MILIEIDSKWISKLSIVEFIVYSSNNESVAKSSFKLIYRQKVYNIVDWLDNLHKIEGSQ